MNTRKAGVLLAVSSLPSNHGIGDFGPSAYEWIDELAKTGAKIWQILPLNPLGYGNSPYQPYSSYAMDECYLSLDLLKKEGLIKKCPKFRARKKTVDYEAVRAFKQTYLKEAFMNFKPDKEYEAFVRIPWVKRYAMFMAIKRHFNMKCWLDWDNKYQSWIDTDQNDDLGLEQGVLYECFVQYELMKQWTNLKQYANQKRIQIMGDLPFYVGIDSEDVWSHQKHFLLDDKKHPSFIAGVPPDYFSETGQRWGNPIYNWEYLKENEFDFWIERLSYSQKLYDIIRIDHFRAFDTYWKIPASCPTAQVGEWVEAPGYELFDTIYQKLPGIQIVAEDLGDLRAEVLILRDHYHLKGMKVIQFTFDPKDTFPSKEDRENSIVYTGTHDNETMMGWYSHLSPAQKRQTRRFFVKHHFDADTIAHSFVRFALAQKADFAIIPMQDILGLKNNARMNTPGTIGYLNWEWKLVDLEGWKAEIPFLTDQIKNYQR
ncbi:MAG: 4-alpha-glucanotransferase [Erysipelotrichaceae bacterium]|nr:4-alpha-glucanotransferase [Erysipelotrichaceae bacterium]